MSKEDTAPQAWNKVDPPEQFKRVNATGVYNFLVKDAWDSKFALPGSYDHGRPDPKRYIGFSGIVADENIKQSGRYITVKMYIHTNKGQGNAVNAFEAMSVSMGDSIGVDDGLAVSELVDQYFKVPVTMTAPEEGKKAWPDTLPWEVEEPDDAFNNNAKQMGADNTNDISKAHYTREIEAKKKRESSKTDAPAASTDDDLPF